MEITTLLGIIAGFVAVIGAMIFKHISFSVFLNPAAFFVIFVGTIATILNSYPMKDLKCIGKLFKIVFTSSKNSNNELEVIREMVDISNEARKSGLLSLEQKVDSIEDPFTKKGFRMVIDGLNEEYILDVLGAEIESISERHRKNAGIFASAGTYAPTLGVLGAVFGLIAAMANIDDTAAMSEAIAAAFIATILGIFTGYVLWHPFATKLKMKSQQEIIEKSIIVEGLLSIYKGESPIMIEGKLLSMLPQTMQDKYAQQYKSN